MRWLENISWPTDQPRDSLSGTKTLFILEGPIWRNFDHAGIIHFPMLSMQDDTLLACVMSTWLYQRHHHHTTITICLSSQFLRALLSIGLMITTYFLKEYAYLNFPAHFGNIHLTYLKPRWRPWFLVKWPHSDESERRTPGRRLFGSRSQTRLPDIRSHRNLQTNSNKAHRQDNKCCFVGSLYAVSIRMSRLAAMADMNHSEENGI